jgi:alkylation response protein AidB-like acyl-CoA dehydrogenase/predicted secreted protein
MTGAASLKQLSAIVEDFERCLGDPHDDRSAMPFRRILELDEREQYPYEHVNVIMRWGLLDYLLPAEFGGTATDLDTGFHLARLVARRDPTTTVAVMLTSLAFMPVWVAGSDEQRRSLVRRIRHGTTMAWALQERAHGSDVLANEMTAEPVDGGGYLVTGEKWLIGNCRVSDLITLFVRTNPRGGPAGFSIVVLDKRQAPAGAVDELPDEQLHGLRGLDLSGVRLDRCHVPADALVGGEGHGLEIALKSAQVARSTILGIALGVVDTALRLVLDFAVRRQIFGHAVADVPYSRRQIADSAAELLVAEAVTLGAVRGLQASPGQTSVSSSAAKYFVPALLEGTLKRLSVVLGARMYLRGHPHYGMFPKLVRDLPVVGFADGNSVVNLKNVALQLEALLATSANPAAELVGEAESRCAVSYDVGAALPRYEPWRQELSARGRDDALLGLPGALGMLRALAVTAGDVDGDRWRRAADLGDRFLAEADRLRTACAALRAADPRGYQQSAEMFALAEQYAVLHAAGASVQLAARSAGHLDDPFPSAAMLLLQLDGLWRRLYPLDIAAGPDVVDEVYRVVRSLYDRNRLLSHLQLPLASRSDQPAAVT